jgi:benzylsuccinate CoA-transferase BbsF subunit
MGDPTLPLDDVKILDFMWVLAGPSATRVLADHGAEVVRIESTRRIDTARTLAPFHDGIPGAEWDHAFAWSYEGRTWTPGNYKNR